MLYLWGLRAGVIFVGVKGRCYIKILLYLWGLSSGVIFEGAGVIFVGVKGRGYICGG